MNKTYYLHFLNTAILIVVSLAARVIYNPLRSTGNLYPDEAYYLVNSRDITNILSNPICFFRSASLITYYVVYLLFGFSLDVFIWVNYIYGVLLTIVTYGVVFDITKNLLKASLSGIFITLSSFFIHASQSNLIDLPIVFWIVVLFYFLYKSHHDRRFILPAIITMAICFFTKEVAFYAVPILVLVNLLFIKDYRIRFMSIVLLVISVIAIGFLIGGYIEFRGYSELLSINNIERFLFNLANIIITNFYLLFNIFIWTYEKYLTILTCIIIIYLILKTVHYKQIYFFETSIFFFTVLFYLALLYINPAKIFLNLGWRYLLTSIFGLIILFSVFLSDLIYLIRFNLYPRITSISLINNDHPSRWKIVMKTMLLIFLILLPIYYIFSEISFYNRYVGVTIYEYDSLRTASLMVTNLKQSNESVILTPFMYQVMVWSDFKFENYYTFPRNQITLINLLNETVFDYIIVSEWWSYHPFELIQENYTLVYSVTDIANRTTNIYKSL